MESRRSAQQYRGPEDPSLSGSAPERIPRFVNRGGSSRQAEAERIFQAKETPRCEGDSASRFRQALAGQGRAVRNPITLLKSDAHRIRP